MVDKPSSRKGLVDKPLHHFLGVIHSGFGIRGYKPGIVLIDAGYGNNVPFLKKLEQRKLKYLGGIAKNRQIISQKEGEIEEEIRIDEFAKSLS